MYQRLCELLEKTGETAYQVSKETGISQTAFSNWKNGIANPSMKSLVALARHFKVPVDYFVENDDKEVTP